MLAASPGGSDCVSSWNLSTLPAEIPITFDRSGAANGRFREIVLHCRNSVAVSTGVS